MTDTPSSATATLVPSHKLTLAANRLRLLHNQVVAAFAQLVQPLPV